MTLLSNNYSHSFIGSRKKKLVIDNMIHEEKQKQLSAVENVKWFLKLRSMKLEKVDTL